MALVSASRARNGLFTQYVKLQLYVVSRAITYLIIFFLASFVFLALLRLFTGISIKRFGYLSLKDISFHLKGGQHISIGKVGLYVHRPTVARPGWFEIIITNCEIQRYKHEERARSEPATPMEDLESVTETVHDLFGKGIESIPLIPEKHKYPHMLLKWFVQNIKAFHVTFDSLVLIFEGKSFVVSSLALRLDLRNLPTMRNSNFIGTLDTYELKPHEIRAIAKVSVSDLLVAKSLDDENPYQIVDKVAFDVACVLDKKNLGAKGLSFSLNVESVHLQMERIHTILLSKADQEPSNPSSPQHKQKLSRRMKMRLSQIGVALVYLVKEVELKISSLEVTRIRSSVNPVDSNNNNVTFMLSTTDISLNIRRMNPKSPGFKLLYHDSDSAHQSSISAASLNFGIDSNGLQEELLYIPLISVLLQTNVFSNTLQYILDEHATYNTSVISGTVGVNSPSVNIETHHLPVLLQFLSRHDKTKPASRPRMLWNLDPEIRNALPKTDLSLNIFDAALRLVYDSEEIPNAMFIMSSSRIHSQITSKHMEGQYGVEQDVEFIRGLIWYRSDVVPRYVISSSELMQFTLRILTDPELTVDIGVRFSNINHEVTRYEIFHAVRCLVQAAFFEANRGKTLATLSKEAEDKSAETKPSALRKLPAWLNQVKVEINNFDILLASDRFRNQSNDHVGLDVGLSSFYLNYTRGKGPHNTTDGRVLSTSLKDLRLSNMTKSQIELRPEICAENFICLPFLKFDFRTVSSKDLQFVQAELNAPKIIVDFNMNVLLAISVVREVVDHSYCRDLMPKKKAKVGKREKVTISGKLDHTRLKVQMPGSDNVMIEIIDAQFDSSAVKSEPSLSAKSIKLYSRYPYNREAWCVIFSMYNPRLQAILRDLKNASEDEINLEVETFRMNIPFEFKLYRIFDNGVTLVKAMRTLIKQTRTQDFGLILQPHEAPIAPKIPKVSVKSKHLCLTLEDDPFEAELNLIFKCAPIEMESRFQKETIFETEVKRILEKHGETLVDDYISQVSERSTFNTSDSGMKHSATDSFFCQKCRLGVPSHSHSNRIKRTGKRLRLVRCTSCRANIETDTQADRRSPSVQSFPEQTTQESAPVAKDLDSLRESLKSKLKELLDSPMEIVLHNGSAWSDFWTSPSFASLRQQKIRLDALKEMDNTIFPSNDHLVSIAEARRRLLEHHSMSWIVYMNNSKETQQAGVKKTRDTLYPDTFDDQTCAEELVVGYSQYPTLLCALFTDITWNLTKVPMDEKQTRDFLFDIGKGLPRDMRFSIFVPLYFDISASGFDWNLRDYPSPVLSFPPLSRSQDPSKTVSLAIKGNFIIAEALSSSTRNIRPLFVPLIPDTPDHTYSQMKKPSWAVIEVHRTLAPTKMYTNLEFVSNSSLPTRAAWCSAYKPAFQSMQNAFNQFSKPPIDVSPVMGFWDKIRLVFHARLNFHLNNSPLYMLLKGSRDPYLLTQEGAGFAFVWDKNVSVHMNPDDNPKDLIVVKSNKYFVTIPDYAHWEKDYLSRSPAQHAYPLRPDLPAMNVSTKVIMKLGNSTVWKCGMAFQRKDPDSSGMMLARTSNFKPHYDVHLSMPAFVKDKSTFDSYHGFRSDFVYLSLSVKCLESMSDVPSYNSVHLTPSVLNYFDKWKGQFSNVMWPPTRSGKLWPGETSKKTKLGTVLSGEQYQLALDPLYLTFSCRHNSPNNRKRLCVGFKARTENFILDLHARKEPQGDTSKRWITRFFLGEVKMDETHAGVFSATFYNRSAMQLKEQVSDSDSSSFISSFTADFDSSSRNIYSSAASSTNNTGFSKSTQANWLDVDDFTDLGFLDGEMSPPKFTFHPMLYTPIFSFVRQTDTSGDEVGDFNGQKYLKFGNEIVHDCDLSVELPEVVQMRSLRRRQASLTSSLKDYEASLESARDRVTQHPGNHQYTNAIKSIEQGIEVTRSSLKVIKQAIRDCESIVERDKELYPCSVKIPKSKLACFDIVDSPSSDDESIAASLSSQESPRSLLEEPHQTRLTFENDEMDVGFTETAFINRVSVHMLNLKWNNKVRDLCMRLKLLFSFHQEANYSRGRQALKYLEDLVSELEISESEKAKTRESLESPLEEEESPKKVSLDLGDCIPTEAHSCTLAREKLKAFNKDLRSIDEKTEVAENSFLVRFLTPQIQAISDKNPDKCVQCTARNIDLRVVAVFAAKDFHEDKSSSQIETRFGALFDQASVFVLSKEDISRTTIASLCTSDILNSELTGHDDGWPAWLALEFCYEPGVLERFLIAIKTDLGVRYDQLNEFHVTISDNSGQNNYEEMPALAMVPDYQETSSKRSKYSQFVIDSPHIEIQCDSVQYFTAYTIAMDLLKYKDPLEEESQKSIERVALGVDITSDFRRSLGQIWHLQKNLYLISRLRCRLMTLSPGSINPDLYPDQLRLETDYRRSILDLLVTMRAFKAALRKANQTDTSNILRTTLMFDEILATGLSGPGKPFIEASVVRLLFSRVSRGDEFSTNRLCIGLIQVWNLLKNSYYPTILSPHGRFSSSQSMIDAEWTTLDSVGGIPIIQNIDVKILPLRFQLERRMYEFVKRFVVPNSDKNDLDESGRTSFDEEIDFNLSSTDEDSDSADSTENSTLQGSGVLRKVFGKSSKKQSTNAARVNEMVDRAANFMNIINFVIHPTQVVVSYKGSGSYNLLDLQDIELNVPELLYANKMWTKEDLYERIQKDLIRIVLRNSGQILGNRFVRHKNAKSRVSAQVHHNDTLERIGTHVSSFSEMHPDKTVSRLASRMSDHERENSKGFKLLRPFHQDDSKSQRSHRSSICLDPSHDHGEQAPKSKTKALLHKMWHI